MANALGVVPLTADILWKQAGALRPANVKLGKMQGDIDATVARRKVVYEKWVVGGGTDGKLLQGNTPLWYYILREAEYLGVGRAPEGASAAFGGQCLGPVGSRIVTETFVGLLWNDPQSLLRRWPLFKPMSPIAPDPENFNLGALVTWVL